MMISCPCSRSIYVHVLYILYYRIAGNIGVQLNLAVGKGNWLLPNFTPLTFYICFKTSERLHLNVEPRFLIAQLL